MSWFTETHLKIKVIFNVVQYPHIKEEDPKLDKSQTLPTTHYFSMSTPDPFASIFFKKVKDYFSPWINRILAYCSDAYLFIIINVY